MVTGHGQWSWFSVNGQRSGHWSEVKSHWLEVKDHWSGVTDQGSLVRVTGQSMVTRP